MTREREQQSPFVPAQAAVNLSQLRPYPEEPERSEGVSKDGRESELAAMVRDGAHRSQVYAGCACYGAPPHNEAERVELVLNRQDLKDSQPRKRGPTLGDVRVRSALNTRVNALMAAGSPLPRGRTKRAFAPGCLGRTHARVGPNSVSNSRRSTMSTSGMVTGTPRSTRLVTP